MLLSMIYVKSCQFVYVLQMQWVIKCFDFACICVYVRQKTDNMHEQIPV